MKLLVAVDLSASTAKVVDKAEAIARGLSAKVWLLHVAAPEPDFVGFEPGPQSVRDSQAVEFHQAHQQIQEIADRFREAGLDTTALLVQGATVATILEQSAKLDANMIVVGSHGRGAMFQLLVGSVSKGVLHGAQCPVLIVPTHGRPQGAA
jgi:nucleotide-binding universal stress UspA family protein